jgi:biopolymer transport protein ExbD
MADEQKATMGHVKSIIRRKLRKVPPLEENSLNIYPMMDMMTILLVFMIMQFAATSANIVQSAELQIPFSTSQVELEEAVPIQISRTEIVVDGDHVLNLRNGQVDPSQKQGGGTGFLVTPLHNVMKNHRDRLKLIAQRNPTRPFRGQVQIMADKRTPFRTLAEVIYTLGQAEFKSVRFVVLKQTRGTQ